MPKLPGVNHQDAVRAFQKVGFCVLRQGRHIIMSDGERKLTIPRHNPINAITMGGIVRDSGLTIERFRELLYTLPDNCTSTLNLATVESTIRVSVKSAASPDGKPDLHQQRFYPCHFSHARLSITSR
jgi:predicted RNA binding protein YcfA (HicA-like mRNA interferase family)